MALTTAWCAAETDGIPSLWKLYRQKTFQQPAALQAEPQSRPLGRSGDHADAGTERSRGGRNWELAGSLCPERPCWKGICLSSFSLFGGSRRCRLPGTGTIGSLRFLWRVLPVRGERSFFCPETSRRRRADILPGIGSRSVKQYGEPKGEVRGPGGHRRDRRL